MQRSHAHRVDKLAGRAKIGPRAMTTQDFVKLMDLLVPRDAPDYGTFTTDPARYVAACNVVAPEVNWPSYLEMQAILRQADAELAAYQ